MEAATNSASGAEPTPTAFGKVMRLAMQAKGINQRQLSVNVNISQSYLSRIEHGERPVTAAIALKLSEGLGGSPDAWQAIHEQTGANPSISPEALAEKYLNLSPRRSAHVGGLYVGTPVRQLRKDDIIAVFGGRDGQIQLRGSIEECEIDGFNPSRVHMTSYDTLAGTYAKERLANGLWHHVDATGPICIAPGCVLQVGTLEHITLPSWLEAELHPPSNIALKPLIVSHGPIIDPKWSGYLRVSVFNPSAEEVMIDLDEPFLTLRFWVAETRFTPGG